MGLTISIIGFIILVILTVYFGWKSLPKYYIGSIDSLVDVKQKRAYLPFNNKHKKIEKRLSFWIPITKEQYEAKMDEYFKALPCGCKLGEGLPDWEIVKRYDVEKIVKDVFGLSKDRMEEGMGWVSFYKYKKRPIVLNKKRFYKKACLKCGTCKDEYYDLIQEISDGIRRIDREIEEKENRKRRAKEICKNKIKASTKLPTEFAKTVAELYKEN